MLGAAGCGIDHKKCLSLIIEDDIFKCHKYKEILKKNHTKEAVRCKVCCDEAESIIKRHKNRIHKTNLQEEFKMKTTTVFKIKQRIELMNDDEYSWVDIVTSLNEHQARTEFAIICDKMINKEDIILVKVVETQLI